MLRGEAGFAASIPGTLRAAAPTPAAVGPGATFRGNVTFIMRDTDGDSLANQILVNVPLNVSRAGVYWFLIETIPFDPATYLSRYRSLWYGNATVSVALSALVLRSFSADPTVDVRVSEVTPTGLGATVEWQGPCPLPDRALLQDPATVDVTFRVSSPYGAYLDPSIVLWNGANAFEYDFDVPLGGSTHVRVPQLSYVVLATAPGPDWDGQELLALNTSLVTNISIVTHPTNPVVDTHIFSFESWSSGVIWFDRTFYHPLGARFYADLTGDGDGRVTDEEIRVYATWQARDPPTPVQVRVDGAPLVNATPGGSIPWGAGPVVTPDAIGVRAGATFSLAVPDAEAHQVWVNLTNPRWNYRSEARLVWPFGWVQGSLTNGHILTGLGLPVTEMALDHQVFYDYAGMNVTAIPVPRALGSISGLVSESPSQRDGLRPAIGGATVSLILDGAVVATTKTAEDGTFLFLAVVPGDYEIGASAAGHTAGYGQIVVGPFQNATLAELSLDPLPPGPDVAAIGVAVCLLAVAAASAVWYVHRRLGRAPPQMPP